MARIIAIDEFVRFKPTLFDYLERLADNNDRPWFQANKERYELEGPDVLAKSFPDHVAASFAGSRSFMRFLCDALKVPF